MPDMQNVCLVDTHGLIVQAMKEAGFTVLALSTGGGVFYDLGEALSKHDFRPDMVLQTESLGHRSLLVGLDQLDCPTIFWAIDPHLNAYWHSAYGRLFDVVCSTQRALLPNLKVCGVRDVRWLPFFGRKREWEKGHRVHDLAFVGRVTDQRPARKWMVEYLKEKGVGYDFQLVHAIPYWDMMNLYEHSRIVPNESIFGEVNFRLFEAASCGCLLLGQALGEEQDSLLEPGREYDTYDNIVEFDEKLSMYLNNERLTRAMGKAAREHILAEHLAEHRAASLIRFASEAVQNRASGVKADKWRILAAVSMWEAGLITLGIPELLSQLQNLDQDADVAVALFHVQVIAGMKELILENINIILGGNMYADSFALNVAGSMAALKIDYWDGAKAFWYRHLKTQAGEPPQPPKDVVQLLTLWAKELKRHGRLFRIGFPYNVTMHLAASSADCLLQILHDSPEHLPSLRLLDVIMRPVFGLEQARVGYLSILTLHERNDWRLALEIALANLKSYRLQAGLEELHVARDIALSHGQKRMFDRALAVRDPSGLLTARLA